MTRYSLERVIWRHINQGIKYALYILENWVTGTKPGADAGTDGIFYFRPTLMCMLWLIRYQESGTYGPNM